MDGEATWGGMEWKVTVMERGRHRNSTLARCCMGWGLVDETRVVRGGEGVGGPGGKRGERRGTGGH